jgi:hypothetical protein
MIIQPRTLSDARLQSMLGTLRFLFLHFSTDTEDEDACFYFEDDWMKPKIFIFSLSVTTSSPSTTIQLYCSPSRPDSDLKFSDKKLARKNLDRRMDKYHRRNCYLFGFMVFLISTMECCRYDGCLLLKTLLFIHSTSRQQPTAEEMFH